MKILLDTNVVLDLLTDRLPYSEAAAELFVKIESGAVTGYLCAATVTTIYFLTSKVIGASRAREEVSKLLGLCEVAPVTRLVLESALVANFDDFEDAVVCEAARSAGADAIVTRNQKDYRRAALPVYTTSEILKLLAARKDV